jgi:ribose 5-phosphate isomerase B
MKSRRPLITERDVRRAAREQLTSLDARGASVTPSARDVARALGITLEQSADAPRVGAVPKSAATPAPSPQPAAPALARLVIGADHGGVAMKDTLLGALRARGHSVEDVGTFGSEPVDYPDFAAAVARAVAAGRADIGIMIDGAGIGSCIVANKVKGVRAAMCYDVTTASNAREHNNANVLTLGGTLIGSRLAMEIVTTFLATSFGGGRHAARVDKIDALDR